MRNLLIILVLLHNTAVFSQVSLTCPGDATVTTSATTGTADCLGTVPTISLSTLNGYSSSQSYFVWGATNKSGGGGTSGLTVGSGINYVTVYLHNCLPVACDTTNNPAHICRRAITVSDTDAPTRNTGVFPTSTGFVYEKCKVDITPRYVGPGFTIQDNCTLPIKKQAVIQKMVYTAPSSCASASKVLKYRDRYIVTWLATDASGNTSTWTATLAARDTTGPVSVLVSNTRQKTGSNASISASIYAGTSYDNCGGSLTYSACKGTTCINWSSTLTWSSTEQNTNVGTPKDVRIRIADSCNNYTYALTTQTFTN